MFKRPDYVIARLMDGTMLSGDCWLWTKYKQPSGYGKIGIDGRVWMAHMASYLLARGQIPEGLELDHLCRARACINPDHLEAVTRAVNVRRGISAERSRAYWDALRPSADLLENMYRKENKSMCEIGKHFGTNSSTVHFWFKKYGIVPRTLSEAGFLDWQKGRTHAV